MTKEVLIQYISMFIAIFLVIFKRKGMKKYIPVAMFAILYADTWCYIGMYYKFWDFPSRLFPTVRDISIPVNFVAVPTISMFFTRFYPSKSKKRLLWIFVWATSLIIIEVLIGKYTNLISYSGGFKWYHSYFLWFISLYIWRRFHLWFYK